MSTNGSITTRVPENVMPHYEALVLLFAAMVKKLGDNAHKSVDDKSLETVIDGLGSEVKELLSEVEKNGAIDAAVLEAADVANSALLVAQVYANNKHEPLTRHPGTSRGSRKTLRAESISVNRILRLSVVPRWQVRRTVFNQSVAEHTLNVIAISLWLCTHFRLYDFRYSVVMQALVHDSHEAVVGDAPNLETNIVTKLPNERRISADHIVKLADHIDACLFASREVAVGNTKMDFVHEGCMRRMRVALGNLGIESEGSTAADLMVIENFMRSMEEYERCGE